MKVGRQKQRCLVGAVATCLLATLARHRCPAARSFLPGVALSARCPKHRTSLVACHAVGSGNATDLPGSEAATLAWLEERALTKEAVEIGTMLFLAPESKRLETAEVALEMAKDMVASACEGTELQKASADAIFLAMYTCAAKAGVDIGIDAWPATFLSKASVPGLKAEDAVTAALAGIHHSVVSRDESRRVVQAYVSATWGEEKSLSDEDNVAFDGVMISTSPQHASIQYCLGVLWGYAVRGLVKRLALDRTMDTVPEALATQKQQLERALAIGDPDPSPTNSSPPGRGRSSFLQYASDFFSHSDWAALCQPVSGAVHVIEAELQEAMHAMAILASLESQDFEEDFEVVSGSNEDFENDFRIDAVLLDQAEWKGFQYRAIVYGCLLADAEGILDTHVGPLPRSQRSWVKTLVQTNALSDVRPDQSRRMAAGILAPIQRVAKVLRERVLTTKLREARRSLTELLETSAASAAAASIAAAAAGDQEPGKEADPELDRS